MSGFQFTRSQVQALHEYGVDIRFWLRGPQIAMKPGPHGVDVVERDSTGNPEYIDGGRSVAEITDKTTGIAYIRAEGIDFADAARNAIDKLPHTPKPRTASQAIAPDAKDSEIRELRRQLDEALAKKSAKPAAAMKE